MKLKNGLFTLLFFCMAPLFAQTHIIAAENNYGVIAKMIGGDAVIVTSILNNPNQDPHLFTVNVETHALLSTLTAQDIVILNGDGYDTWMEPLIKNTQATVINVALLNQVPAGANPHLWYDLPDMDRLAKQLAFQLSSADPSKKKLFAQNVQNFLAQSQHIQILMQSLRAALKNIPVIATEPVANYLTDGLGLDMLAMHFQLSVMNDTEPSAQDRADFLRLLHQHKVRLLIYNQQVTNPVTTTMRVVAEQEDIPVLGVNELLPQGKQNFLEAYQEILTSMQHILLPEATHAKKYHCV